MIEFLITHSKLLDSIHTMLLTWYFHITEENWEKYYFWSALVYDDFIYPDDYD